MGSSGGGGGSGEISWPEYLENMHSRFLNALADVEIPGAIALNPYTLAEAHDPAADLAIAWDAVCEFDAFVDGLAYEDNYESAMVKATTEVDKVFSDAYINADINAFADIIDNDLNTRVLPQFKAGLRDVNAIMSSAFVMGEADIYAARTREVTKYGTDLRLKSNLQRNEMIGAGVERMLNDLMSAASLEGDVARLSVEAKRISTVALKEQVDGDLKIGDAGGRWNLNMYVYGQNMLSGISGGSSSTGNEPSTAASALGGALGGAAVGAQIGSAVPGVGTAVGAVVGGLIGLGAALL